MEEQFLFDRIHDALDIEPPAGASERLRTSLIRNPVRPYRSPALQTRWSKMGFRFAAGVALVALGAAITAAFFAIHSAPSNIAPAAPPAVSPAVPQGGPVPPSLYGAWREVADPAVVMILAGTDFALSGNGLSGVGKVAVNGSEIDFYNGTGCGLALPGGIGKYRMTISGGLLMFSPLNSDPCPRAGNFADPKGWQPISPVSPT
jgi:hypothetical protein